MPQFSGASLRESAEEWREIGAPLSVIQWIERGVEIPFTQLPAEQVSFKNKLFNKLETQFLDKEIQDLCDQRCIVKCEVRPFIVSPINLVPKKDGSFRLITDLRYLNSLCKPNKFLYEDISDVLDIVEPRDALITLDIKNGFYHIPVSEHHQQFLGFEYKGAYYKWAVCPFGANFSPYFFCKTVRAVVQYLRQFIRTVAFVDDFIVCEKHDVIEEHKAFLVKTLVKLGWFINFKKSDLCPTTSKEYIGFIIDTVGAKDAVVLKIPTKRLQKLKREIKRIVNKDTVKARQLARVCGQCISMTKAVFPAKLLLRNLYRVLRSRTSWRDELVLDEPAREDLNWWYCSISAWNGRSYSSGTSKGVVIQIATDASGSGYGGVVLGNKTQQTQGFWTQDIAKKCSNYREIMAVYMSLIAFKDIIKNQMVQILSDNVATVSYIVCMGGPSQQLTEVAKRIWDFAIRNNVSLSAKYLCGAQNTIADGLSRYVSQYEWALNRKVFQCIDKIWGPHSIDRFANMSNTQLAQYNSLWLDPNTAGVDAFSQEWAGENNFINPPLRLMNRVLDKIIADRAIATLVCPAWPAQNWFQKLTKILECPPLKLPKTKLICIPQSTRKPEPMKNPNWRLLAWRVNGNLI